MLILTSSGQFITSHDIDAFLPKKIADCKIAYVITASKKVDYTGYIGKHEEAMDKLNRSYTEMDIAGKSEEDLRKILTGYDIVLVEGGNTFYLLKAIRESGFDKVIKDLISQGLVYIGSSAGTYVACPSIIMAELSDSEYDKCGVTEYSAMDLVPFLIKCHYTPEKQDPLEKLEKDLHLEIKVLDDSQALVIDNDDVQLIGGDEVIM